MIYFNCLENIKINFLLLLTFIILIIFMLIKTYIALINNIALHRENKIIKRSEKAFDYWLSNLIQLFFSISLIVIPLQKYCISNINIVTFISIFYLVLLIFLVSILHGIYLSLTKTKKTILGKVYWKKKDAKMFKRVIIFKFFFSIVMIGLIVYGFSYL